jgi:broad specificity phosphatase PhoE
MIYLIRHGQTEFNRADRFQGRVDSPLTELGVAQARAVGARLAALAAADPGDWRIACSPLGRARHTAEIIAEAMGLGPPTPDERLIEVSYGALDGLTRAEVDARFPHLARIKRGIFTIAPGGEPIADVQARAASWLADNDLVDGVRRIAVAHASIGRVLRGLYAGLDIDVAKLLETPQDAFHLLYAGAIERIDCHMAAQR